MESQNLYMKYKDFECAHDTSVHQKKKIEPPYTKLLNNCSLVKMTFETIEAGMD